MPPTRRLVVFALAAIALPVHAQQGRIEGVVTDSVHGKPLADAIVYVTREEPKQPELFRALVSDKDGRYHLDSLVAGRYSVSFSHAMLDSLELAFPSRDVALTEGEHAHVDFAVPPGPALRMRACPGVPLPPGTGALVGHVADAETDRALVGALVVVSWIDISLDRATLRASSVERTGAMRVDSSGVYRLCGVPTGNALLVQLQMDGRAGSALRTDIPDDVGIKVLNLSFSAAASKSLASLAPPDSTKPADTVAVPLLTGNAEVTGIVRTSTGEPLKDVSLRVVDAEGSARTDSLGHFSLGGLPAGSQLLEARHLGYLIGRQPVELRGGRAVNVSMHLDRIVLLDSIRVVAQRNQYKQFEQDKHFAFGHFYTAEQIGERHVSEVSDLFYTMLGFRVIGRGFEAKLINTRGGLINGPCAPNVVIDNMQNQDINLVEPSDVGAMEVYADGFSGPYGTNRGCGVVMIWTKR